MGRSVNSGDTGSTPRKDATHSREDAVLYDQQAVERGWQGHKAFFGLMRDLVDPGETILDIGIGTGLSSLPFHERGLQIYGFDSSKEMLEVCESKGFAVQLVQHDLRHVPFPYPANSFNHVISLGVLNFFADLRPVFEETARIIRPHGIFGFTVEEQKPGEQAEYLFRLDAGSSEANEHASVAMYRHSDAYVRGLLDSNGFSPLRELEFLADRYPEQGLDIYFKAYVARKT